MNKKDVIILAAGVGSRLRPLTDMQPKSLVKVNEKSILHRLLDQLEANAEYIGSVKIAVGYKKLAISDFLKSKSFNLKIDVVDNEVYDKTNNMYSLHLAMNELTKPNDLVIINADCCYEEKVVSTMVSSEETCIAIDRSQFNQESMKVRIDQKDGSVIEMTKALEKNNDVMVSMDIYHFTQESKIKLRRVVSEFIEGGDLNSWTEVAIDRMVRDKDVKVWVNDFSGHQWMEIDDHSDLKKAEQIFA